MKTKTRFIKSVIKAAAGNDTVMPWARGTRRTAAIAKRSSAGASRRKSA